MAIAELFPKTDVASGGVVSHWVPMKPPAVSKDGSRELHWGRVKDGPADDYEAESDATSFNVYSKNGEVTGGHFSIGDVRYPTDGSRRGDRRAMGVRIIHVVTPRTWRPKCERKIEYSLFDGYSGDKFDTDGIPRVLYESVAEDAGGKRKRIAALWTTFIAAYRLDGEELAKQEAEEAARVEKRAHCRVDVSEDLFAPDDSEPAVDEESFDVVDIADRAKRIVEILAPLDESDRARVLASVNAVVGRCDR